MHAHSPKELFPISGDNEAVELFGATARGLITSLRRTTNHENFRPQPDGTESMGLGVFSGERF